MRVLFDSELELRSSSFPSGYALEHTNNDPIMEYRPRYPQPFTLEQIVQLDVITITEGSDTCSPAVVDIIA